MEVFLDLNCLWHMPDVFMLNEGDIFRIMQHAASLDAMVSMHAENGLY